MEMGNTRKDKRKLKAGEEQDTKLLSSFHSESQSPETLQPIAAPLFLCLSWACTVSTLLPRASKHLLPAQNSPQLPVLRETAPQCSADSSPAARSPEPPGCPGHPCQACGAGSSCRTGECHCRRSPGPSGGWQGRTPPARPGVQRKDLTKTDRVRRTQHNPHMTPQGQPQQVLPGGKLGAGTPPPPCSPRHSG